MMLTLGVVNIVLGQAPPPPQQPTFRFLPTNLQWNSYVHFDENGKPQQEQSSMSLNVQVLYDPWLTPTTVRKLTVERIMTDRGEDLRSEQAMPQEMQLHPEQHQQGRPRFNLYFQLKSPAEPARSIALLEASMEVVHAGGELREAQLPPLVKVADKRVRIVGVENGEVKIRRTERSVQVEMPRQCQALLQSVRFVDGAGRELAVQGRGHGSRDNASYREYYLQAADDTQVVLRFYSQLQVTPVRIEMANIPLPSVIRGAQGFDMAIEARPLAAADAGNPPAALDQPAKPADNPLEVQLLD